MLLAMKIKAAITAAALASPIALTLAPLAHPVDSAITEIAVVTPVPKNFGWGVLSWITVMCQVSVNVSPSGLV